MQRAATASVCALFLVLAACGVSSQSTQGDHQPSGNQPGVTAGTIRVGAVASVTNPIGGRYSALYDGITAYFRMVNQAGGVNGRRLELAAKRDDQTSQNKSQVLAMLQQDNVFAVMVATLAFTGADLLVQESVPTFGWNVNREWGNGSNLFGDKGSYFSYDKPGPLLPWLARETGATRIGIISYNVSQSTGCAKGDATSFDNFATAKVVFTDTSLPFGVTDLSSDVSQMRKSGAQLVLTCIDENAAAALGREMHRQGLNAPMYLPNSYDQDFVGRFGDVLAGSYVMVQFAPFEVAQKPAGLERYTTWMKKIGKTPNEVSLAGWISADQLVTGLRTAGPAFTRQSVVRALNGLTDYDAGGILPGIDWTIGHTAAPRQLCYSLLKVVDRRLAPQFGTTGKPFVCFDRDAGALPTQPVIRG